MPQAFAMARRKPVGKGFCLLRHCVGPSRTDTGRGRGAARSFDAAWAARIILIAVRTSVAPLSAPFKIEQPAAPFPSHPVPCRLWPIMATRIDRSRIFGLPARRGGKTLGRGGWPIRLTNSRHARGISDSQRSSPMYGTRQSRTFAAQLRDKPDLSASQPAALLGVPGRRYPALGPRSGLQTRAASGRGTARGSSLGFPSSPAPAHPHAAGPGMLSHCSSDQPAGNPRHDLRGVTAAREGRDYPRMRCRCPARVPPSPGASRSAALAERGHMHRSGEHRFVSSHVRTPSASPRRRRRAHPVIPAPPPPAAWL